jgi:membrane protein YqaA with SNARE-associated domain
VPIIGDPIAFAAGTLKYNITFFLIFVSIGKIARYLIIYLYFI